jgi:hypothetical protein
MQLRSVVAASLLLGCSSGNSADAKKATCPDDTFQMSGELDSTAIDIASPVGSFSVVTAAGAAFDVDFGAQGSIALTHSSALDSGKTSDASGALTMPTDAAAHPAETLCVGTGSSVTYEYDQGLRVGYTFKLNGIASGANCDVAVVGSLEGCFAHVFQQGP